MISRLGAIPYTNWSGIGTQSLPNNHSCNSFNRLTSSKESSDKFEWTTELIVAFKSATPLGPTYNKTWCFKIKYKRRVGPLCSQKTQKRWNSSASHFLLGKVTTVYEHVVTVPARSCWCRNHCRLSSHLDQWVWTHNHCNAWQHACCEGGKFDEKRQDFKKSQAPVLVGLRKQEEHHIRA